MISFIFYLIISLGVRFYNFKNAFYFIYDIGRDATVLRTMAGGDLRLVGPTTGLPGMFLGPLWYYLGLPGFFLGGGDPYVIQIWYIFLASLSIPLFWILSHRLFGNSIWAKVSALLLSFIPGSLVGTNFVWNPMLALPLMTGALLCLLESRKSALKMYLGFFLLALTLQSEFAYAIFFVAGFIFLVPWLRGKWEWKMWIGVLAAIGLTLIPQILFETAHGFSMTKALTANVMDTGNSVSQIYLFKHRPQQLWQATLEFFTRNEDNALFTAALISIFILTGAAQVFLKKQFPWLLVLLMAVLPYAFYMFWRGNSGYFFDYYITSHFIFPTLLLVYGMKAVVEFLKGRAKIAGVGLSLATSLLLLHNGYRHLNGVILRPDNQAGIAVMEAGIQQLYNWSREDGQDQAVFRVYTPNTNTEQYDYLIWWLSKKNDYHHPLTIQSDKDSGRYLLYEPFAQVHKDTFFKPWYEEATRGFTKTRSLKVGILTLESWAREK